LIGEARAKQTALLGDDIDAETAVEWGLALDAVPADELMNRARALANRLRNKPATALHESKSLFDPTISSYEAHVQATLDARWTCQDAPESREVRDAMREDRAPTFERPY